MRRYGVVTQKPAKLNAGETRHDEIGHHEVRRTGDGALGATLAGGGFLHLVSLRTQALREESANGWAVVDDEDSRHAALVPFLI